MATNVSTIKLEAGQESVTEIQTYLETFNKEIEGQGEQLQHVQCKFLKDVTVAFIILSFCPSCPTYFIYNNSCISVQQVEGLSGGENGGTYFVDQTGQYYFQANGEDTPVMTQVQIQEVDESVEGQEDGQDERFEDMEGVQDDGSVSIQITIFTLKLLTFNFEFMINFI